MAANDPKGHDSKRNGHDQQDHVFALVLMIMVVGHAVVYPIPLLEGLDLTPSFRVFVVALQGCGNARWIVVGAISWY